VFIAAAILWDAREKSNGASSQCLTSRGLSDENRYADKALSPKEDSMFRSIWLVLFLAAIAGWSCEPGSDHGRAGADGDADGDGDTDGDGDGDGDTDSSTDSDICDEQDFAIEIAPVRLMILLDMSYSMVDPDVADPTNWSYARPALVSLLTNWKGSQIEFGLDTFPDSFGIFEPCSVTNPIKINAGPGNEQDIIDYLNSTTPNGGGTPLYCGMANFLDSGYAAGFPDAGVESYLVVVSDGADNCGVNCGMFSVANPSQFAQLTQDLLADGIKSIAIGFGAGVNSTAQNQLNAIAQNGGTPFTTYFYAELQEELEDAFELIAGEVISCVYDIEDPDASADPDNVNFYFDDEVVLYDEDCAEGIGWTWVDGGNNQVEFCEEACNQLKGGEVQTISAKFGCPTQIIE